MSEQRVLEIKKDDQTIISKEWDFEAMCIVDDVRASNPEAGKLRMTNDAIHYLFTGTNATNEVIKGLTVEDHATLALKVFNWYLNDIDKALKNVQSLLP